MRGRKRASRQVELSKTDISEDVASSPARVQARARREVLGNLTVALD